VSISGDYIVAGAPFEALDENDATSVANSGAAYIFKKDPLSSVWSLWQKIVAGDRAVGDNFGRAVAIHNDYIIVSAPSDDKNAVGTGSTTNAGSAYIFEKDGSDNWIQKAKVVASDRVASDLFGISVSINGNNAIVGTNVNKTDANNSNSLDFAGAAYIYERDGVGNWTQKQKIVSADRKIDSRFGTSVAINNENVIVGAIGEQSDAGGNNPLTSAGAAYIFNHNGSNWQQVYKFTPTDRTEFDNLGTSVAINGDNAIVTANNKDLIVGFDTTIVAGAAYMLKFENGTWLQKQKLTFSNPVNNMSYGRSSSIDNNYAIIGGNNPSTEEFAYIYKYGCQLITGTDVQFSCAPYTWIDGNTYSSSTTAVYNIVGGASNGCDSIVTLDLTILPSATSTDIHISCGAYTWIDGNIYSMNENAATYTINNGAANGCDSIVTLDLTIVTSVDNTVIMSTISPQLTANQVGATYQWIDCNTPNTVISGETAQTFIPTVNGSYAVIVTAGDCSDTSFCIVVSNAGLEDVSMLDNIKIYPNPSLDGNISIHVTSDIYLTVTDLYGRSVINTELKNGVNKIHLNENNGVYLFNFTTEKNAFTKRVIIR
jgi:hypothetical protein